MLNERNIKEEWLWRTINNPDETQTGKDENIHYYKEISECNNRIIHVVINPNPIPKKVITIFFDRKARRKT
jgi:hypothetical protein